jgi:hypothetical protein
MQVDDQKIDCQLTYKGQTVDTVLHLIEVRYSERITFWNGVTQLTEDDLETLRECQMGEMLTVRLADGRTGFLYVTQFRLEVGYSEIAGVGKPSG